MRRECDVALTIALQRNAFPLGSQACSGELVFFSLSRTGMLATVRFVCQYRIAMAEELEDEYFDQIRSADEVARRCIILHAVLAAGHGEPRDELVAWLRRFSG